MSDIDFQNGFIVGMATKGLTRNLYRDGAPVATVISSTNSYMGALSMTYIVLEFSEAIGSYTFALNSNAFWIFGYKDFVLTDFDLQDIIKISDTRFAFKLKNFSSCDGQMVFAYTASKGALQGVTGPVKDFFYRAAVLFETPRIKIQERSVQTFTGLSLSNFVIVPAACSESFAALLPSMNEGGITEAVGSLNIIFTPKVINLVTIGDSNFTTVLE